MRRLEEMLPLIAVGFFALSIEAQRKDFKMELACEGEQASLNKCPENHGILIDNAQFGRNRKIFCPLKANSSNLCGIKNVKNIVKAICDRRNTCQFAADTSYLGQVEGCTYTSKYVEIYYTCVRKNVVAGCLESSNKPNRDENSLVTTKVDVKDRDTQFSVKNASSVNQLGLLMLIISILETVRCLN